MGFQKGNQLGKGEHPWVKNNGIRTRFKTGQVPWNKGFKGKESHGYGRIFTEEEKQKIRDGIKKHYDQTGRKSTRNRLMRKSKEFYEWRKAVFERDNYTCQECKARSQAGKRIKLHPHHLKELSKYPELAFVVSNGKTLCEDCHKKKHKNLTGKQATNELKEPMKLR